MTSKYFEAVPYRLNDKTGMIYWFRIDWLWRLRIIS